LYPKENEGSERHWFQQIATRLAMAKKKNLSVKAGSRVENSSAEEKTDAQKGLSKEAWVAIGTIVAALITGTVTLLMHLLPQAPPARTSATDSSTPITSPSSQSVAATADDIAGKWAGMATDSTGVTFQITLEIKKSCALNEQCGLISVSHVPCYGEVFLEKAQDTEFEFRVANFYGQSNRVACQPGAGETFKLRPDGKLVYKTTYEPAAQGILERIGVLGAESKVGS